MPTCKLSRLDVDSIVRDPEAIASSIESHDECRADQAGRYDQPEQRSEYEQHDSQCAMTSQSKPGGVRFHSRATLRRLSNIGLHNIPIVWVVQSNPSTATDAPPRLVWTPPCSSLTVVTGTAFDRQTSTSSIRRADPTSLHESSVAKGIRAVTTRSAGGPGCLQSGPPALTWRRGMNVVDLLACRGIAESACQSDATKPETESVRSTCRPSMCTK